MARPVALLILVLILLVAGFTVALSAQPPAVSAEPLSPSAAITVWTRPLGITAHDVTYSPARNLIYASVGATGLPRDNGILPITPSGVLGEKIPVDGIPSDIYVTPDGQFLYVSLLQPGDNRPYMQRVNLNDGTTEPKWELVPGEPQVCGFILAADMFTLADDPHALVVARRNSGCSPHQEGVAIYDDGVMRPETDGKHSGPTYIEPSAWPEVIYGYDGTGVYFIQADAEGITITGADDGPSATGWTDMTFVDGLLYFDNGKVYDPVALKEVAGFELGELDYHEVPESVIDPVTRRAYFLIQDIYPSTKVKLMIFDMDSRRFIAGADMPTIKPYLNEFVQVGPNRFAVQSYDEELLLMDVNRLENTAYVPVAASRHCAPFLDNFSDPTTGWSSGSNDLVESGYIDDEYRILSKADGYVFLRGAPACEREHYEVAADARWQGSTGALYGITFGIVGNYDWFYWFAVSPDTQQWVLYRFEPDGIVTLAGPQARSAILTGNNTNHLQVIRRGRMIDLYVNGEQMTQLNDTTIHGPTRVGLAMTPYNGEPSAEARFDNFMYADRPALNDEGELRTGAGSTTRTGEIAAGTLPMTEWWR